MSAIDLIGFSAKFESDDDPWATFTSRDERLKRAAVLHALGSGPIGRVLELASGNGSNSVAIAPRALRLDATEGTVQGAELTARALTGSARVRASRLVLPAKPPRTRYDAVVVAELLYYLSPRDMARVARDVAAVLAPGGVLVLAHHRVDYYDFAQHAANIHARFLAATGAAWRGRIIRRTGKWIVLRAVKR